MSNRIKSAQVNQFISALNRKTFRKPCFVVTQKSLDVNIKNKV